MSRPISRALNRSAQSPRGIPPRRSYASASAGSGMTMRYGQPLAQRQVSPTRSASRTQPTFSVTPPFADEYSARIGLPSYVRIAFGVDATAAFVRGLSAQYPP